MITNLRKSISINRYVFHLKEIDAINYYLNHKEDQISIGKAARELMENSYSNDVIVNNLITFCKELISK